MRGRSSISGTSRIPRYFSAIFCVKQRYFCVRFAFPPLSLLLRSSRGHADFPSPLICLRRPSVECLRLSPIRLRHLFGPAQAPCKTCENAAISSRLAAVTESREARRRIRVSDQCFP